MSRTGKMLKADPRCTVLESDKFGPFVKLSDGSILTVEENASIVSRDEGKSWSEPRRMYKGSGPGRPSTGGVMLRTRGGVLVYVYMDSENFKFSWSEARREAGKNVRLDVWVIRSLNEGKTWIGRKKIFEGYCGALIDMIETSTGQIVVPVQRLVRDPCRHCICVYVSADGGKTWQHSNIIDLGGHGHHDGAIEPTLVELKDGRLWMLIRTNLDRFWEAYSSDNGLSWRVIKPSEIDASSAPGYLVRLDSGRLALVWNRLYPRGKKSYPRTGGDCQLSAARASWHRDEVSFALSEDDGRTWSEPVVILRMKGGGLSYPYVFERAPGELWISTRWSHRFLMSVRESDFVEK